MKNSKEEAIEIMRHWIEYEKANKERINKADELISIQKTILSDYKRVLKENKLLRKDIEGWKKYCKEIEEELTEMSNKNCELEFKVEKLQKENEELKEIYRSEKKMKNEYIKLYQDLLLKENVIPTQNVKDRIEELNRKIDKSIANSKGGLDEEFIEKAGELLAQKRILQELLESEE